MQDPAAFERFLIDVSARLSAAAAQEADASLDEALRQIGVSLGTDRVTLLTWREGAPTTEAQGWARAGFEPATISARLPEQSPWYHAALLRGDVVALAHVDRDLPAEAELDRGFARAAGVKSHLAVPIAVGGQLVCALSTSSFRHYCTWSARLIDRFRLVGQLLAQALIRARAERDALARRPPDTDPPLRDAERIQRLDEVERDYILHAIDRCGGRINGRGHAAEQLGLHPNTLRSRMKKLGIQRRARRAAAH